MSVPTTLRSRNMQQRRERILHTAHALLASGGFEALSLRELARQAEVTVPTIYNLVGNKEEVLVALFAQAVGEIEARMRADHPADPLALAEAVVSTSTGLFAEDEGFYRAAFLAVEALEQAGSHPDKVARLFAGGEALIAAGIDACRAAGLLRGRLPASALVAHFLRNFRMLCRGWAFGQLPIGDLRREALADLYVTLAADAVETFQAQLARRIAGLQQEARAGTPPNSNKRKA